MNGQTFATSAALDEERRLIIERLRNWGGSASDALLDPSCKMFTIPNIDGLIGYKTELSNAIVFGDPVCAPSDIPKLTHAFHEYCTEQGLNVIYVMATELFAKWAMQNLCKALIEVGEELSIDPYCDPRAKEDVNGGLVRRKVRHAQREGVVVHEYLDEDVNLETEMETVGDAWLKSRHGPQIFISHVRLFENRFGKRWFYAEQNGKIVGVVMLNQLHAHQGWLLNHLMIKPEAPHGTPELLVVSALEAVKQEGCHFVNFGTVPARQIGEIQGFGKITTLMLRKAFDSAKWFFKLEGRKKFWEKYHPESQGSYVLFSKSGIGLSDIVAIMRALNASI